MNKPLLYSYFRSSCSYRVRVALHYKNIDFEYRPIHLVKDGGEQLKDPYLKLNPKGEVPFFIDGDVGIGQSMAILLFLEDKYPQNPLVPKDPLKKAHCLQLCELINSGIQPIQNLKVLKYLVNELGQKDEIKAKWANHWITEGFIALENFMKDLSADYCIGSELSLADCFLVPQVYNANRFKVGMDRFPHINRVNENCLKLDCFQKADPANQPDAQN